MLSRRESKPRHFRSGSTSGTLIEAQGSDFLFKSSDSSTALICWEGREVIRCNGRAILDKLFGRYCLFLLSHLEQVSRPLYRPFMARTSFMPRSIFMTWAVQDNKRKGTAFLLGKQQALLFNKAMKKQNPTSCYQQLVGPSIPCDCSHEA